MITLCCSLKVRKRLGLLDKVPPPKPATTVLGNWYVSLQHFGKLQMEAGLGGVLLALGVNPELVTREQQEMEEVAYATATNRRVVGSVNQLGMFLGLELERTADLLSLALRLSHIPMSALKGKGANTHPFPDIVTLPEQLGPIPTTWLMTRCSCAKSSQVVAGVLRDQVVLRRAQ